MSENPFSPDRAANFLSFAGRWFAVECHNRTWDLMEKSERTSEQTELMLHAAHASCLHWMQSGNAVNHQRAQVLLANAHAEADSGELAMRFARLAQQLCTAHREELADWDVAFTLDAMARAHAAHGASREAVEFKQQARQAAAEIADAEDRKVFEQWFTAGKWGKLLE